jgi:hypothetical protein
MSAWRDKPPNGRDFTKRRAAVKGRALIDAAHRATHRLYCDALRVWRQCPSQVCRRHRRCFGEPTACLIRALPAIPAAQLAAARQEAIAGGPHRVASATHIEWVIRWSAVEQVLAGVSDDSDPPRRPAGPSRPRHGIS